LIAIRPLRLAFNYIPRSLWAGGHNYQRNLFAALNRHRPGEFLPVVFAGITEDADDLTAFATIPNVTIVQDQAFNRRANRLAGTPSLLLDRSAATVFKRLDIDVVIESARFFGFRLPYPVVAWFPDVQHRRLPELFSRFSRWRREVGFRLQIASGRTIMLGSESARRDCQVYYPGIGKRASVVRFATRPADESLAAEPAEVIRHYGLPDKFFYLPNQFWPHKNHQVVIDALTIVAERGVELVIAASGSKNDRDPGYFDNITRQVAAHGQAGSFRYLGMIPMPHVYALLRSSVALVNPSRFEGWSTPVEEAKSFGVPMILSDIDVHREQTSGGARYFNTDDPAALAEHLLAMHGKEPSEVRTLLPDVDLRVSTFASDFASTVHQAWRESSYK
jgi:glycosyltransferase involved in cell wall biosynthesis